MTQYLQATASRQEYAGPEIREALRAARHTAFRLEDEFEPFGWQERCELAAELRDILDRTPEELRPLVSAVEFRLESEAYALDVWDERIETLKLAYAVVAGLKAYERGGDAR